MKISSDEAPPCWVWRVTLAGIALIAALTATGALLLALGTANPPLAGPVAWQDTALAWAGGPTVHLQSGVGVWYGAPPQARLPGGAFTLDVRARFTFASDPSAAWGIWLATGDDARIIYAISGEQYLTTRRCPASAPPTTEIEACPAVIPDWRWAPYNRIRVPGESNQITLHRESSGDVRLRINDEKLGVAPVVMTGRWGVWVRGGRDSGAVIEWEHATVRKRD